MNAIHVNWTKPNKDKGFEDFELLTTILSALKWREKNGSISLVTDKSGYDFYKKSGLDIIWDNGTDVCLDDIPDNIDPSVFWAAGKIFALKKQNAPIAVIDTDFIVWDTLPFDDYADISVIHFENPQSDIYPSKEFFKMKDGYTFDSRLDWSVNASNTAFYIVKDSDFINTYTDMAIEFMQNTENTDDRLRYMVFAEQRLFSMCAKLIGKEITQISDLNSLFNDNGSFTHTWGMKQQMRDNAALREKFCQKCIDRIIKDFPYMESVISKIPCLERYFK